MKLQLMAAMAGISTLLCAAGSAQPEAKLLDLTVVALDNHGQPVTDLTADDFEITDAGKPQKISLFRKNQPGAGPSQPPLTAPNQFSNRVGSAPPNAVVVLMDLLNMGYGARGMAAHEIVRNFAGLE